MADCPVDGCTRHVRAGLEVCPRHWMELPIRIRDRVLRATDRNDAFALARARSAAREWWADRAK